LDRLIFDDSDDEVDARMKMSSLLMFSDVGGFVFERFKSVEILTISPHGLEPMPPHISGSNGPVSECPPA